MDLVTPLQDGISVPGTMVHIYYAVKMGPQYRGRYELLFLNPDIRAYDMQHEVRLVSYPRQWADEVKQYLEMNIQDRILKGE